MSRSMGFTGFLSERGEVIGEFDLGFAIFKVVDDFEQWMMV